MTNDELNRLLDLQWTEALEAAATKLDHYAAGLEALGGRGATAIAAAKMVRGLKAFNRPDAAHSQTKED